MIGIYSPGIWRIPHLEKFLAQPCQKLSAASCLCKKLMLSPCGDIVPARRNQSPSPKQRENPSFVWKMDLCVRWILASMASRRFLWWWMIVAFTTMPASLQHWRNWYRIKPEYSSDKPKKRRCVHTIVTGDLSKYNLAPAFVVTSQNVQTSFWLSIRHLMICQ